jgi:hypothetical protein
LISGLTQSAARGAAAPEWRDADTADVLEERARRAGAKRDVDDHLGCRRLDSPPAPERFCVEADALVAGAVDAHLVAAGTEPAAKLRDGHRAIVEPAELVEERRSHCGGERDHAPTVAQITSRGCAD